MAYTNIDDPSAYFQTAIWTGDGNADRAIVNDGNSDMQPDWVWYKSRSNATSNILYDSSRGADYYLKSNTDGAEGSDANMFESFDSDGFSLNADSDGNASGRTYVAWQWKANGGTTSSNTDGSITSTVQANTDAGFSIMTYSGTTGDVHTIGHGLGVTPDCFFIKCRNGDTDFPNWWAWHKDMAASNIVNNRMLRLNTTDAILTYTGITSLTSSTIQVKSSTTARSGKTYVAYAFAEKQGYSKFGSYVGNGNADGPFVYTGFKPAFIMWKRTSGTSDWVIWDNKRDPDNAVLKALYPNVADAESTSSDGTGTSIDILSNGFKMRTNNAVMNGSGEDYIFMAFAENPFTTSTGIPTTAR